MSHHTNRIVVLVDMDCFYCQVEEILNPELKGKPVAVVQYNEWRGGGIIAVNYEARAKGVTRHMRGNDAKAVCPDINLIKVPQIRGKANLNKYRNAGKQVADILQTFTALLERASVDEAYLDITEAVDKHIQEKNFQLSLDQLEDQPQNTFVVGSEMEEFITSLEDMMINDESKLRLAIGGIITEQIRAEVYKVTGYRCSAGVAHNKILAKLACGLHKPNKQTLLPQDAVPILFEDLPVKKIKGFGGKLGEEISQVLNITTMGELSKISEKELARHFDDKTSTWIHNLAQGIDNEPVTVRLISKSIGCSKNFLGKNALVCQESVELWLEEFFSELLERLEKDLEENNRKAKNMTINFTQNNASSSRTCQINSYEKSKLMKKAVDVLNKNCRKTDDTYKITHLGLNFGNFEDVKNVRTITSFFKNVEDNKKNKQKNKENITNIEKTDVSKLAHNINSFDQAKLLESSTFLDSDSDSSEDDNSSVFSTSTISENNKSIKDKVDYFEKIRPESILDQNFPEYDNQHENIANLSSSSTDSISSEIYKNIDTKEETKRPSSSSFFEKYFNNNKDVKREFDTSKIFEDNCEHGHFINEDSNEGKEMEISVKSQEKIAITNDFCKQESPVKKYDSPQRKIQNNKDPQMQNIISENNVKESCSECGKLILLEDLPSHMDYHFALKIVKKEAHLYQTASCSNMKKTQQTIKNTAKKTKRKSNESTDSIPPISKFFFKENPMEMSLEESELCTECNKRIKLQDLPSHFDYHAAKRLHLELNSENEKPKNSVHILQTKNCVKEKTKVIKSGTSITSFFKNI